MKALRGAAALRNLREQPLWKLLAATKAPVVIALLQALFMEADKALPGSVLLERLARDVDALRSTGEDLPQAPQAYVAEWLNQGWLTRRFPTGAPEEEYELSAEALTALRFVSARSWLQPAWLQHCAISWVVRTGRCRATPPWC